jgi:Amt family ammonium transporter
MIVNCQIAGLVAISASCARVEHYSSCIIGVVASFLFMTSRVILQKLQIDDPLNVTSIHLVCGVWGLIAAGIFTNGSGLIQSGDHQLITTQVYAILSIVAWAFTTSYLFFQGLHLLQILRIGEVLEVVGLDYHEVNLINRNDHVELLDRSFLMNLQKMKKLERVQR